VQKAGLCGSTPAETRLKAGRKTWGACTEKVQWRALSPCSGRRFWDGRLRGDLQECSRSQELRLCWKQLIPLGLEYVPPLPHHQVCPASRTEEISNGNLLTYSDKRSSAAQGILGALN